MPIKRAAKNLKARNGFEFSFEAPTRGAAAKPPPKPAPTIAHTPSVASYVQVLSSPSCASCRGRLRGVTATCSQCQRGMHEQCFVVVEGDAGRVEVGEEGEEGDNQWCFACACRGGAKSLGDTNTQHCTRCKCYLHVMCINDGVCLSCARPAPEQVPEPRREVRAFHTSWQSGRPWLKMKME